MNFNIGKNNIKAPKIKWLMNLESLKKHSNPCKINWLKSNSKSKTKELKSLMLNLKLLKISQLFLLFSIQLLPINETNKKIKKSLE
jgi:hypothetical protein